MKEIHAHAKIHFKIEASRFPEAGSTARVSFVHAGGTLTQIGLAFLFLSLEANSLCIVPHDGFYTSNAIDISKKGSLRRDEELLWHAHFPLGFAAPNS
jgi:hypothetical protein